jgi:predicted transcriptional regulator
MTPRFPDPPTQVKLGPGDRERLKALAARDERTVSALIRLAVREYLDRREREDDEGR